MHSSSESVVKLLSLGFGGLLCLVLGNTSSDTEYFLVPVLLLFDLLP